MLNKMMMMMNMGKEEDESIKNRNEYISNNDVIII
jgi:hypothetical protein